MPEKNRQYEEYQHVCPHCNRGTNFRILGLRNPMREDKMPLLIAAVCSLCEKMATWSINPMGSTLKYEIIEQKKRKTTKRIG